MLQLDSDARFIPVVNMSPDTKSINAGPLIRALVVSFVKARSNKYLRRVWKRGPGLLSAFNMCIKVERFANMGEAYAMQFVEQHTSIPVPKVHCAFVHDDVTYIVMSKIPGQLLGQGWHKRSAESKRRIHEQLRNMMADLRSICPPDGMGVGNVNGGPICDCRLPNKINWGPFASVRAFHEALANGINPNVDYGNLPPGLDELFEFYRRCDNRMVFSHGDLSSLNILARGNEVVGIVDWETSGWFPPYWESTCAKYVNIRNLFWEDEVDHFLDPIPHELKMENIRRQYFGDV